MSTIKQFATVTHGVFGERQVNYRQTGRGPHLLMLHQSPLSSRDLVSTMEEYKHDFTCIAPDTPGYGFSDPFGINRVDMRDIACGLVEFMDAIGISKFSIYGFHTGAMIAIAIASYFPDRVIAIAANGYVGLSASERHDLVENYLPPFAPDWSGSHLAWAWSRMREQMIFYPWYKKEASSRMNVGLPTPQGLHDDVMDLLRSGDNYRVAYRAAFTFRGDLALANIRVPTLVSASEDDPLASELMHIGPCSDHVEIRIGGDARNTRDLCRDFLMRFDIPGHRRLKQEMLLSGRLCQQWIQVDGRDIRVLRNNDRGGRVLAILHDVFGSAETVLDLARSLIESRPVVIIDFVQNNESLSGSSNDATGIDEQARIVASALDHLGIDGVDVLGIAGGALIGLQLSLLRPSLVETLVACGFPWINDDLRREMLDKGAPSVDVDWYGGHLLMCWHMARDSNLFWPWYQRDKAGVLDSPARLSPEIINKRALAVMTSPEQWRKRALAEICYPLQERILQTTKPILLCTFQGDPLRRVTHEAAHTLGDQRVFELPDRLSEWKFVLLPALERA